MLLDPTGLVTVHSVMTIMYHIVGDRALNFTRKVHCATLRP